MNARGCHNFFHGLFSRIIFDCFYNEISLQKLMKFWPIRREMQFDWYVICNRAKECWTVRSLSLLAAPKSLFVLMVAMQSLGMDGLFCCLSIRYFDSLLAFLCWFNENVSELLIKLINNESFMILFSFMRQWGESVENWRLFENVEQNGQSTATCHLWTGCVPRHGVL